MAELRTGGGRALLPSLRTELNQLRRRLVLILELGSASWKPSGLIY
jgi:hypothetical protein